MTTIPAGPAAMWAELRAELSSRRESLHQVACDLDDEGNDGAGHAFGRVAELDETIKFMDLMAGELTPMTTAEVGSLADLREFMAALRELWRRDPEAGHSWDDRIRERVLQLCAAGHPDAAELAREVLVTSTWDDVASYCS